MEWIDVEKELPNCWSQHKHDYGSGYLLGYTKYNEVEITQLWNVKQEDGTYKKYWEGDDYDEGDYIIYWMPLPKPPNPLN